MSSMRDSAKKRYKQETLFTTWKGFELLCTYIVYEITLVLFHAGAATPLVAYSYISTNHIRFQFNKNGNIHKFKKSDYQTDIDKYRVAAIWISYSIMFKMDVWTFWLQLSSCYTFYIAPNCIRNHHT